MSSKIFNALKAFLFLHTLLLCGSMAHAQTACPPGMVPYGSGTDMSACGYSAQTQAPPIRWTHQWGAIATYATNGVLGTAVNMPSQEEAERTAMADCRTKGGTQCKLQITYHDQCVAMVLGDKAFNLSAAANVELAAKSGIERCSAESANCHVYYSACSLPKQAR